MERGGWVDNRWVWEWDWTRDIRGKVCKEFEDLLGVLHHVIISNNCRDRWRWSLNEDGEFTVKELSRLVEEKILRSDNEVGMRWCCLSFVFHACKWYAPVACSVVLRVSFVRDRGCSSWCCNSVGLLVLQFS
ncbi:hypothetical protein Tco_0157781, partial [Tanacetum coccineum]